jgi:hypothetical protein
LGSIPETAIIDGIGHVADDDVDTVYCRQNGMRSKAA